MAYDRIKIFEQAKELIVKHKLFFVEDVVAFLPCVKSTFYDLFPEDSNESNILKDLLNINKIEIKTSMRSKWYKSDNATLQMALMKLICTTEERKKLAMNYTDVTTNGKEINQIFKAIDLSVTTDDSAGEDS